MRVALLLIALAGCADGVAVSRTHYTQLGIPQHVELAAGQAVVPVALHASPFAPSEVLAAMRVHNPRPYMNFSTDSLGAVSGYRIVLGFGSRPVGGSASCAVFNQPAGSTPTGKTGMYGAFCLGDTLLSEASATAPMINNPYDPGFARLTGDLLLALLPFHDPLGYERRCRFPFC